MSAATGPTPAGEASAHPTSGDGPHREAELVARRNAATDSLVASLLDDRANLSLVQEHLAWYACLRPGTHAAAAPASTPGSGAAGVTEAARVTCHDPQCARMRVRAAGLRAPDNFGGVPFALANVRIGMICAMKAAALSLIKLADRHPHLALTGETNVEGAFAAVLVTCLVMIEAQHAGSASARAPASASPPGSVRPGRDDPARLAILAEYLRGNWPTIENKRALAASMVPPALRRDTWEHLRHTQNEDYRGVFAVLTATMGPSVCASQTERVLAATEAGVALPHAVTVADVLGAVPALRVGEESAEHDQWKQCVNEWFASLRALQPAAAPTTSTAYVNLQVPCGAGNEQATIPIHGDGITNLQWPPTVPVVSPASNVAEDKNELLPLYDAIGELIGAVLHAGEEESHARMPGVCILSHAYGEAVANGLQRGLRPPPAVAGAQASAAAAGPFKRAWHLGTVHEAKPKTYGPLVALLQTVRGNTDASIPEAVTKHLQHAEKEPFHPKALYEQIAAFRYWDGAVSLATEAQRWEQFFPPAPGARRKQGKEPRAPAVPGEQVSEVPCAPATHEQGDETEAEEEHSKPREVTRKVTLNQLLLSQIPGISDETIRERMEELALYTSRSVFRGSQLARIALTEALESGRELPAKLLSDTFWHQAFNITSPELKEPIACLHEAYRTHFVDSGINFPSIDWIGSASQCLSLATRTFKPAFVNNIRNNLRTRLKLAVTCMLDPVYGNMPWTPPADPRVKITAATREQLAAIVCARIGGWPRQNHEYDEAMLFCAGVPAEPLAAWVQDMRGPGRLGLDGVGSDSAPARMTDGWLKQKASFPGLFRVSYVVLNYLEEYVARVRAATGTQPNGVKLFNLVPYKRVRVDHVYIDARVLRQHVLRDCNNLPADNDALWKLILNPDTLKKLHGDGYVFSGTISTDGVTAAVHFRQKQERSSVPSIPPVSVPLRAGKRGRSPMQSPREALAAAASAALAGMAPQNPAAVDVRATPQRAMGCDTGRKNLMALFEPIQHEADEHPYRAFKLTRTQYNRQIGKAEREADAARWLKIDHANRVSDALSEASTKTAKVANLLRNLRVWCSPLLPTGAVHAAASESASPAAAATTAAFAPAPASAAPPSPSPHADPPGRSNYDRLWAVKRLRCWRHAEFRAYRLKAKCLDRFFRSVIDADPQKRVPVVAWGDAKFASTGRGEPGGVPTTSLARRAAMHWKVEMECEFRSSQACMYNCMHQTADSDVYQTGVNSDGETVTGTVRGLKFCKNCVRLLDRDVNAAANILLTYTMRMARCKRPQGMRYNHVKKSVDPIDLVTAKSKAEKEYRKRHAASATASASQHTPNGN